MGKMKSKRKRPRAVPAISARSIPLEELARQQGVKPIKDISALGALLPEDFDPDAFEAFIAEERKARRQAAQ